jgi:pyruvate dehydrogenase E2 component (dihydrolipoamide acetyltransferase)
MSVEIVMPQLGLTMTEGSVSTWLRKPGENVKKDEIILAVATDKVDMDVESPVDGTMGDILVEVGTVVPVGTVLAHILQGDDEPAIAPASLQIETAKSVAPTAHTSATVTPIIPVRRDRIIASPRAKKIAAEHDLDIGTVQGSGPSGRIVVADVEAALSKLTPKTDTAVSLTMADANARRRQVIADRMVESIQTIPAFSVSLEINAAQLVALYENLKDRIAEAAGTKLTYTDLLLKALTVGLSQIPEANAVWENGASRPADRISVAMAVATDRGVVAPVLQDTDRMSLDQLVHARWQMTLKARESKLTFADLEGATGTLSNLGMYRVDRFEGIITPGQTFILAAGQLRERPWIVDRALTIFPTLVLTLSIDHRVVDGAVAARLLGRIAEAIENPYQLLWNTNMAQAGSTR